MTCLYMHGQVPLERPPPQPAQFACDTVIACTSHLAQPARLRLPCMHLIPCTLRSQILLHFLAAPSCRRRPHLGTLCQRRGQHTMDKCQVEGCSRQPHLRQRPQLASWRSHWGNSLMP